MDYYRTLGIRRDATSDEVKAAFRALALKFHPDRHATSDPAAKDKAGARFKEVSEAYQVLSNDAKRAIYNREGRAGLRGGGEPRYQQYARYRGGGQSQYARYQYDQSFRARESGSWWRAPMRGFGRTDYIIHASIALLGLGAFLFIDQAGESLWKRHNTGKSFEELQAARQARSQSSPQDTSTKEETTSAPSRPPQLLVRRPNPGWPFHRVRQHGGFADAQNSNNVRKTRGVGEQDGLDGGNSNISRGRSMGKASEGSIPGSDSGQRLGDAARVALNRKVVAKPSEQVDLTHVLGADKPVAKQRKAPPSESRSPSKIESVS